MAILWCGGEEIDLYDAANVTTTTDPNHFRSTYARGAMWFVLNGTGRSAAFAPVTDFWVSYRISVYLPNVCPVQLEEGGTPKLGVGFISNGDYFAIRNIAGGTNLVTQAGQYPGHHQGTARYDVHFNLAASTVTVYQNYGQLLTYSGALPIAACDRVRFLAASQYTTSLSEVIIATEDTRAMTCVTLAPTVAGTYNTWVGDGVGGIDEIAVNDTDVISSPLADEEWSCQMSDLPAGTYTIKAVKDVWRGVCGADGITGIVPGVITNGQTHYGPTSAQTTAWQTGERLMLQNPVTSNNWQVGEVNAAELAFKSAL